jgi:hypothetical protein
MSGTSYQVTQSNIPEEHTLEGEYYLRETLAHDNIRCFVYVGNFLYDNVRVIKLKKKLVGTWHLER